MRGMVVTISEPVGRNKNSRFCDQTQREQKETQRKHINTVTKRKAKSALELRAENDVSASIYYLTKGTSDGVMVSKLD